MVDALRSLFGFNGFRQGLLLAAVVGQFLLAIGYPRAVDSAPTALSRTPFPCQGHSCGCANADACWVGDCCCFTLEQKVNWAIENGYAIPDSVRERLAEAKPKARKKSCCEATEAKHSCCEWDAHEEHSNCCAISAQAKKADSSKRPVWIWVSTLQAMKCSGHGPLGVYSPQQPSLPVRIEPSHDFDCLFRALISIADIAGPTVPHRPDVPPPKNHFSIFSKI